MVEVTDPAVLSRLNSGEVTDPDVLAKLNAGSRNTSMVGMPPNPNEDTSSPMRRAWLGAGIGIRELPKGIGQTAGDIVEGFGGNRPSWAPTKEDVEYDRQRLATYGKAGKVGEVIGDLIPQVALAAVTRGRGNAVMEQAAIAGLHPHESVSEQILDAVLAGGITHGLMGMGELGAKMHDFITGKSGFENEAAQKFLDKGYAILPSEFNAARKAGGAQTIAGKTRMENAISLANQKNLNREVTAEFGLPEGTRLSSQVMDQVIAREGAKIDQITSQPIFLRNPYYKSGVLENAAQGYEPLEQIFQQRTLSGKSIQEASRYLREMGHLNIKAGQPGELGAAALKRRDMGRVQLELADKLEESFTQALEKGGGPSAKETARIWDEARKTQAKAFDVKAAVNDTTGNISAKELSSINRNKKLSGSLKDAADMYDTYGNVMKENVRANPILGTFEGSTFGLASAMHRPEVMALLAARPVATWAGKRAAYQNWLNAKARQEAIERGQHLGLGAAIGLNELGVNNQ